MIRKIDSRQTQDRQRHSKGHTMEAGNIGPECEIPPSQLDAISGGGEASKGKEQTLKIGSASTGAGAGKISFDPF